MPGSCTKKTSHRLQPIRVSKGLSFSTTHQLIFQKIVQETQQVVSLRKMGKLTGRIPGLLVLFSGPGGTGKTMVAEVIARELRTSLYRVSFNNVVSKYIVETEKNLARVFETHGGLIRKKLADQTRHTRETPAWQTAKFAN